MTTPIERVSDSLFAQLDTNGDGKITKDEFLNHMRQMSNDGSKGPGGGAPAVNSVKRTRVRDSLYHAVASVSRSRSRKQRFLFVALVLSVASGLFYLQHEHHVTLEEEIKRGEQMRETLVKTEREASTSRFQSRAVQGGLIVCQGVILFYAYRYWRFITKVQLGKRIGEVVGTIQAVKKAPRRLLRIATFPVRGPLRLLRRSGRPKAARVAPPTAPTKDVGVAPTGAADTGAAVAGAATEAETGATAGELAAARLVAAGTDAAAAA